MTTADLRPPPTPYGYRPEELVVGLPHAADVEARLRGLGIEVTRTTSSDVLGLALLQITDVADAARKILDEVARTDGAPATDRPLDQVLWGLRRLYAAEFAGWVPVLGKNRVVSQVYATGESSYGAPGQNRVGAAGESSYGTPGRNQVSVAGESSYGAPGGKSRVGAAGELSYGGGGNPEPAAEPPGLTTRASGPGRGVRVGILDTALYPHPWLAGGWTARFSDVIASDGPAPYSQGHATFLTGLVLNQAPGATVEVRGVLGPDGAADSWTVAEEMVRFGRSGLDVLNLSFVCYTEDGDPPLVLATAVDRLDPELVVVAAAGNHGRTAAGADDGDRRGGLEPAWPAALDDVVAVGAVNAHGDRAAFSPAAPWVDVQARGVDLTSTYLPEASVDGSEPAVEFGGWARWSGTSFAAALVSGAVAAGSEPGRVSGRDATLDLLSTARDAGPGQGVLPLRVW